MKKSQLKTEYANKLIQSGIEPYSVVRHSYTNNRLTGVLDKVQNTNRDLSPTLDTRCDCLGVATKEREGNMPNLRIRKLTPCECLKLMGFTREDYDAMRQIGMSDSQIYHCAGDSLITTIAAGLIGVMCLDEKELRQKQENYVEVVRTDEKKNN